MINSLAKLGFALLLRYPVVKLSQFVLVVTIALLVSYPALADDPWEASDENISHPNNMFAHTATTAEQLLDLVKNPMATFMARSAVLDEEQTQQAIATLRARYPFVSIRQRVERLEKFSDPVLANLKKKQSGSPSMPTTGVPAYDNVFLKPLFKDFSRALTPVNPYARLANRDVRTASLRALHSDSVREFITKPGNGFGRFPITSPYQLPLFESRFAGFEARPIPSSIANEAVDEKYSFESTPDWNYRRSLSAKTSAAPHQTMRVDAYDLHQEMIYGFAGSNSTGFIKSIDQVAGFEPHEIRLRQEWKPELGTRRKRFKQRRHRQQEPYRDEPSKWEVNRVQLVSLLMHSTPQVYDTDQLLSMDELESDQTPVRDTDPFETAALKQLFGGKEIVIHKSKNRMRMLGAIKCTQNCISCHTTAQPGDVLGAFSYEILRTPPENEASNNPVN